MLLRSICNKNSIGCGACLTRRLGGGGQQHVGHVGSQLALLAACRSLPSFSGKLFGSSFRSGTGERASTVVQGGRDDHAGLLKHVDAQHRDAVARILEQAERAVDSWTIIYTDFYPPPVVADAMVSLQQMANVCAIPWGGYSQAERCRIVLGREETLGALQENPQQLEGVAALECKGNFMFDPATHRDFLGACLGTGIERDKVGDILVTGERGAHILVAPNLVEHLEQSLTQVRTVPVQARSVELSALQVRAPRVEEVSSVEASLRLDAVASAGFRESRSKMADRIKAGDVRVNWRSGAKPSAEVKAGDLISCSGKGRVEVVEASLTKKGKYSVRMVRYV